MACSKPIHDETDEEDHLTDCGICLSEIENPKALPCLHSFCLKCLRLVKHPPGVITCPLCQEDIPLPPGGVDGFRDNFFINQLKERRAIHKMGDVKMACICCRSTDRETVARCMDCNGFLCQQCVDLHKNITPLRAHSVFTIEELKSGKVDITKVMKEECCQEHKDQVLRWFCKTCGIPICRDCTVMEHRHPEHDYVTMESAYDGQLAEIKKLLANCKGISQQVDTAITGTEKVELDLKTATAEAIKQLDNAKEEAMKAFLTALEENYQSNKEKLDRTLANRCEKIHAEKKSLQNLKSKLNNALKIANQVTKSGSKYDVTSNYSTLIKTLSQLQGMQPHAFSKSLSKVNFKASKESNVKSVNLGSVSSERPRLGNGKWVLEKEIGKEGEGKLSGAYGVAIAPNEDIMVADCTGKNVKVFDSDGRFKWKSQGEIANAHDVAIGTYGQFFVTNRSTHVKVYSPEGQYLKQFPAKSPNGTSSDADGSALYGLAIDNDGHLLVANYNKKYVSKHKQDGTHVSTFKIDISPIFIAVTSQGRIVACPNSNTGVQVLDHTGNLLHSINAPQDAKSWHPVGVCCSNDGVIYISSYNQDDKGGIYSFTNEGKYLGCVTTDVTWAEGIALTEDDKLVVAQDRHPAKVFSFT